MGTDSNKESHFWERKVSISHFFYVCLICAIILIAVLVIVPGRINDDAYQNFSFAATITSIVLAVVSIVYSLQSGLSSLGQLNGIREIEARIGEELNKFSSLESSLKETVKVSMKPLETSMGILQSKQDDIKKAQDSTFENWGKIMESVSATNSSNSKDVQKVEERFDYGKLPILFLIIIYACARSFETQKNIPYSIFRDFLRNQASYIEGAILTLSVCCNKHLKFEVGKEYDNQQVVEYDADYWGSRDDILGILKDSRYSRILQDLIGALDKYYEEEAPLEGSV